MRQLSWLHISDLHIKSDGDSFSQQEACRALTRHIADAGESFPQIHFVLVTGDVAYSGRAEQYVLAEDIIRALSTILAVPQEQVLLRVPAITTSTGRSTGWHTKVLGRSVPVN